MKKEELLEIQGHFHAAEHSMRVLWKRLKDTRLKRTSHCVAHCVLDLEECRKEIEDFIKNK